MKRRKPGKALEASARAVHNSDEFLAHVAGVAALYRRERELAGGEQRNHARSALKGLERHAGALEEWLKKSTSTARPEQIALNLLAQSSGSALTDIEGTRRWLALARKAATSALDQLRSTRSDPARALRIASEALRATFEHHDLRFSTTIVRGQPSPALALLTSIARDCGDKELDAAAIREALKERSG